MEGRPVLFVDSSEKIERVHRMLADSEKTGLDTEFYGHEINKESPVGKCRPACMQLSLYGPKLKGEHDSHFVFVPRNNIRHFRDWLGDEKRTKVLHNAKADMHPLENVGVPMKGLKSDTMVKCFMAMSAGDHSLKGQMKIHFDIDSPDYTEVFKIPKIKKDGEPGKTLRLVKPDEVISGEVDWAFGGKGGGLAAMVKYSVKDPYYTIKLDNHMDDVLRQMEWVPGRSMLEFYDEFACEFTEVLYKMERRGSLLDQERLYELRGQFQEYQIQTERKFYKQLTLLGVSPSIIEKMESATGSANGIMGSSKQLGILFTEHLGIELPTTPSGQPQTNDAALQWVRGNHQRKLADLLLEWRQLHDKLIGTYVGPLIEMSEDPHYGGRAHTTLKQTGANTGRLSSANPNLQNIPIRTEYGRLIRSVFCAPKGHTYADIDLSQIELRLISHFSRDPIMIQAYEKGLDLHCRTAVEVFPEVKAWVKGRPLTKELLEEIGKQFGAYRGAAKNTNFMIAYGGRERRYMEMNPGSTKSEASHVIKQFFKTYRGIDIDMNKTLRFVRQHGYIRTLLRRYVHFPDIRHPDQGRRMHAERAAYNAKIQGSAADMIMMAMLLIHRNKLDEKYGAHMNLQVHDELCFEIPNESKKEVGPIIAEFMSHPYRHLGLKDLRVDTPADMQFGKNWSEAH